MRHIFKVQFLISIIILSLSILIISKYFNNEMIFFIQGVLWIIVCISLYFSLKLNMNKTEELSCRCIAFVLFITSIIKLFSKYILD